VQRQSVKSSLIESVGYEGSTLEVELADGKVYSYPNVPVSHFQELLASNSKGEYFNRNIRPHFKPDTEGKG
jgi:KTSC domain